MSAELRANTPTPPANRGPQANRWASVAARGAFALPVCQNCGRVQYPLRERCRDCLSSVIRMQDLPRGGRLLAATRLHRSNHGYFATRVPLRIGTIELDAGTTVLAFVSERCAKPLQRVHMKCGLDLAGQAILIAVPEEDKESDVVTLEDPTRQIEGKIVLLTGANGGIGTALTDALLRAGAAEVIAAVRSAGAIVSTDPRVRKVELDVTDRGAVDALSKNCADRVDILINNSGVNTGHRVFEQSIEEARREMEVNYFGLLQMAQAFMPTMMRRGQGVVVNMLTVLAHVNLPIMATYCASKAAAQSVTQALRAEAAGFGVRVVGVFPSVVDTPMSAYVPTPKLAPEQLAIALVDAIRNGSEDLYPGSAEELRFSLQQDWKVVERSMAVRLDAARKR